MSRVIQNGRLDGCQTSSPPSRRSVCRASLARSGDDRMIGPSPRNDRPAGEGCQAVATPAPARPNLLKSVPLHLVLTNPAQWTASKRSHPSDSSWPQPAAQLAQQPRSANDRCLAVTCRTMPRASKGGPRPSAVARLRGKPPFDRCLADTLLPVAKPGGHPRPYAMDHRERSDMSEFFTSGSAKAGGGRGCKPLNLLRLS